MDKIKCKLCDQEVFWRVFKIHLLNIHVSEFKSEKELSIFALKIRYNLDDKIISEVINDYKTFSILQLKQKYKLSYRTFQTLFKLYNIPIRDSSKSAKLKSVRKFYKETCNKKYGFDNVSQSDEVKNKKAETFYENYGVDNIFRTDDFKKNFEGKTKTTSLKYWASLSPEDKKARIDKILKNLHKGSHSTLEKKIRNVLITLGIPIEYQFSLEGSYYDLNVGKLIIEVNGDFWHANPRKYLANDVLNFPGKKVIAQDIWKKDEVKKQKAIKSGFNIIYLWESDIKSMTLEELEKFLLESIQKYA